MEEKETHISRSRCPDRRRHSSAFTRAAWHGDGWRWKERAPRSTTGSWVGARDRSWGVRYGVGVPPEDIEATTDCPADTSGMFVWMPVTMTRPDGRPVHPLRATTSASADRAGPPAALGEPSSSPTEGPSRFGTSSPTCSSADDNRRLLGGTIARRPPRRNEIARTGSIRSRRRAFTSAPGSTAASKGTIRASGGATCHTDGEHITGCDTVPGGPPHPPASRLHREGGGPSETGQPVSAHCSPKSRPGPESRDGPRRSRLVPLGRRGRCPQALTSGAHRQARLTPCRANCCRRSAMAWAIGTASAPPSDTARSRSLSAQSREKSAWKSCFIIFCSFAMA